MAKFHITPKTGNPGSCRAVTGACPFGSTDEHYPTKEAARAAFEKTNEATVLAFEKKTQSLPAFHGSKHLFDAFSYDHLGAAGTQHGWGFYFADKAELIGYYAGDEGFVYHIDFHPQAPLPNDKLTLTESDMKEFVEFADKKTNGEFLENWGDVAYEGRDVVLNRAIKEQFYKGEGANDVETITNFLNTEESVSGEVYSYLYNKYGYDSITLKDDEGWTDGQIYVATVPEAFDFRGVSRGDGSDSLVLAASHTPCKNHSWTPTLEQIKDSKFTYQKCSTCNQVEKVAKN